MLMLNVVLACGFLWYLVISLHKIMWWYKWVGLSAAPKWERTNIPRARQTYQCRPFLKPQNETSGGAQSVYRLEWVPDEAVSRRRIPNNFEAPTLLFYRRRIRKVNNTPCLVVSEAFESWLSLNRSVKLIIWYHRLVEKCQTFDNMH